MWWSHRGYRTSTTPFTGQPRNIRKWRFVWTKCPRCFQRTLNGRSAIVFDKQNLTKVRKPMAHLGNHVEVARSAELQDESIRRGSNRLHSPQRPKLRVGDGRTQLQPAPVHQATKRPSYPQFVLDKSYRLYCYHKVRAKWTCWRTGALR